MGRTVLVLAALLAATVARGDEPFAGQWIAISAEENGASAGALIGHRLTFDDGGYRIVDTEGKLVAEGSLVVDAGADPATVDFDGRDGTVWSGIWKLDGSLLTIVDNAPDPSKPRPSAFAAPVGSGYAMLVFTAWK